MTTHPASKPNILVLMTDQHRYDCLGVAGHSIVKTPHLDRLAAAGIHFPNAYCPSPVCGPCRGALMSGIYPPGAGCVTNHLPLSHGYPLLTDRLANQGYHTAHIGKLHLSPVAGCHGFHEMHRCDSPHSVFDLDEIRYNAWYDEVAAELYPNDWAELDRVAGESERLGAKDARFWEGWSYIDDKHHMTTWTGQKAVEFLDRYQDDVPFFLHVSFFGPHHPYASCEPWDSMYNPDEIALPTTWAEGKSSPIFARKGQSQRAGNLADEAQWRRMIAKYYGQISQIDHQIGQVLDALKRSGRWGDTMIVMLADHGDHIGEYGYLGKNDMVDTSVRIPLIVKPAGADRRAEVCSHVVNSLDLFGTYLDLAGDPWWREDEGVESQSLLPLVRGEPPESPNRTYSIIGGDPSWVTTMVRDDHHKLIRRNLSDSAPLYELYDLEQDPLELDDRYTDDSLATRRAELQLSLDRWTDTQIGRFPTPATQLRLSKRMRAAKRAAEDKR